MWTQQCELVTVNKFCEKRTFLKKIAHIVVFSSSALQVNKTQTLQRQHTRCATSSLLKEHQLALQRDCLGQASSVTLAPNKIHMIFFSILATVLIS